MSREPYGETFYKGQCSGSAASAELVLPLAFELVGPVRTLVDVGCGTGTWSATALALGVQKVVAIDGPWARNSLRIAPDSFREWDLERELPALGPFDLAICLEVAEHLPAARAAGLVADLCRFSDNVLFSAAVPGQGGTNHVNEQWLSAWISLFQAQGFGASDRIRRRVWEDEGIDWWYAQNMVLFQRGRTSDIAGPVDIIHPRAWRERTQRLRRLSGPVELLRPLGRRLPDSIKARVRRVY